MTNLNIEYNNKKYSIAVVSTIEELNCTIECNKYIIQFPYILKEQYDALGEKLLGKKSTPPGYMYLSEHHCPFGNTSENMKLFSEDINRGLSVIPTDFCVCYYKRELHGLINDILKYGKLI